MRLILLRFTSPYPMVPNAKNINGATVRKGTRSIFFFESNASNPKIKVPCSSVVIIELGDAVIKKTAEKKESKPKK